MSLPSTSLGAPPQVLSYVADIARSFESLTTSCADDAEIIAIARDMADRLRSDLKGIVEQLDYILMTKHLTEERSVALPNGWTVERYRSTKEEYDDEKVTAAYAKVLRSRAIDPDTGELLFRPEFAERIVDALLPCMTATKPKKQAMKAHGIDPRELCEIVMSPEKVRVVAPEVEMSQPAIRLVQGGAA